MPIITAILTSSAIEKRPGSKFGSRAQGVAFEQQRLGSVGAVADSAAYLARYSKVLQALQ